MASKRTTHRSASPASRQPSRRPAGLLVLTGRRLIATATRGGQPLEVERGLPGFQLSRFPGCTCAPPRRACRGGAAPTRSRHAPARRGPGVRACGAVGGGAWPPHGPGPRARAGGRREGSNARALERRVIARRDKNS